MVSRLSTDFADVHGVSVHTLCTLLARISRHYRRSNARGGRLLLSSMRNSTTHDRSSCTPLFARSSRNSAKASLPRAKRRTSSLATARLQKWLLRSVLRQAFFTDYGVIVKRSLFTIASKAIVILWKNAPGFVKTSLFVIKNSETSKLPVGISRSRWT